MLEDLNPDDEREPLTWRQRAEVAANQTMSDTRSAVCQLMQSNR